MADCVGIDQLGIASPACLTFATNKLAQAPVFWGRYFKGPGNTDPGQYQADEEASFFHQHGIRVLPIARQTPNVSKPDIDLGRDDGADNAAALIDSFGADHLSTMPEVAVFLDAEPDHPLNHLYYQGWSAGLIAGGISQNVQFAPCVYAHHRDGVSWSAVGDAISAGAICHAAWIVFMESTDFPIGPWKERFTGTNMPSSVRVAITQRILDLADPQGRAYDFDLVNPDHKDWLLPRLVLPRDIAIA
jgi:hypothetical protein